MHLTNRGRCLPFQYVRARTYRKYQLPFCLGELRGLIIVRDQAATSIMSGVDPQPAERNREATAHADRRSIADDEDLRVARSAEVG